MSFKLPANYIGLNPQQKIALIEALVIEFKLDPILTEDICAQLKIEDYKNASNEILDAFLKELEKRINFRLDREKEAKSLSGKIKKTTIFRFFDSMKKRKQCLNSTVSNENMATFTDVGVEFYNKGDYENALLIFRKLCEYNNTFYTSMLPQMEKCKNVINKSKNSQEKSPSKILKLLGLQNLIRCKYCGKYTNYIDPNEPTYGFAPSNNCSKCGRMYFAPSFYWDSWGGMEYMKERHSVPDKKFYEEYDLLKIKEKEWIDEFGS